MERHTQWWSWAVAVAGLAILLQVPVALNAQDAQVVPDGQNQQGLQDANAPDPPNRVARLNFMAGSVSFQPGGENDWVTAVLNRPLVTGDNLWADEDSRAEVHIGSTALRLGSSTGITLLEVSDRVAQIRLAQGSLIVKVRHVDDDDSYEIDTPNVAFVVAQPGDYRINVDPDGNRTEVTVWRGRGDVTGAGSSYTLMANQYATFTGTDQLNYELSQTPTEDGFDTWALDRDRQEDQSDSANYVSRDMTGYEDLDAYGDWSYVAGYGMSWRPRVVEAGWAPYRFGHWAWVGPWGWTWVADEPWGFAPFHYGRWALAGGAWLWVPGPSVVRPIYAPALVAWVGGGPGRNFSFSFGAGVGWFPLAPGEVFIPGYRTSRLYVNNVNFANTRVDMTRITNVYNTQVIQANFSTNTMTYANRNVVGGVTVVSRDTFVNARPVARNVVPIPTRELAAAPVSRMVAIEPVRSSVIGTGKPVSPPPAAVRSRAVVALRTPAPMPSSFDQKQPQAGGHLNQSSLVRQQAPGRPVLVAPQTRQPRADDGFRSFGQPSDGTNQVKPMPRVWEAQGTPEPEKSAEEQTESRSKPSARQWSHPLTKPVAPVRQGNTQQQRDQTQKSSTGQQRNSTATANSHAQQNAHSSEVHAAAPKK
ncbi:MAG: DUF6600 domain-containing protein [Candidatus Sulfotelmatobacter sp.]